MFKFSSSKKKRESQQGTGAVHTTAGRSTHTEINALHEKIAALTLANITMKNEMSALESELKQEKVRATELVSSKISEGALLEVKEVLRERRQKPVEVDTVPADAKLVEKTDNEALGESDATPPSPQRNSGQIDKIAQEHPMLEELRSMIDSGGKKLTYTAVKHSFIEKYGRKVFVQYKEKVQFLLSHTTDNINLIPQKTSLVSAGHSPKRPSQGEGDGDNVGESGGLDATSVDVEQVRDLTDDSKNENNEGAVELLADENNLWVWGQVFDDVQSQSPVSLRPRCHSVGLNVTQVACAWQVTSCYYLDANGDVFVSGNTENSNESESGPAPRIFRTLALERALTKNASRIIKVSCGSHHILALTGDGRVYSWGDGSEGCLGHGTRNDESVPRKCENLLGDVITQLACGSHHSMFLSANNLVYTCGDGSDGRLGLGTEESKTVPTLVEMNVGAILNIACGWDFSAVVAIEGVKTKKGNIFTQFFSKNVGSSNVVQIGEDEGGQGERGSPKLDKQGKKGLPGKSSASPSLEKKSTNKFYFGGRRKTAGSVSMERGTSLLMWGNGQTGQCGSGEMKNELYPATLKALKGKDVVDVACGHVHTVALCANGGVYAWGGGESGQLGTASIFEPSPQYVDLERDLGEHDKVKTIACGAFHTVCGTSEGRVFSWGSNTVGALGLGHKIQRGTPTPVLFPKSVGSIGDENDKDDESKLVPIVPGDDMQIFCAFNTTFVLCKKKVDASNIVRKTRLSDVEVIDSKDEKNKTKRLRILRERWENQIIPQWHSIRNEKWVVNLCRSGIPFQMREFAWPRIIGNAVKVTPKMYRITLNHAKQLHSQKLADGSVEEGDGSKKEALSLALIDADLARTFPGLNLFGGEGPWSKPLRECLEAFAMHRPDLGYVQGMSYMAAMLLLNISDQYLTFQCLVNLMVKDHLFVFYLLDSSLIHQYLSLFDSALESSLNNVYVHFQNLNVNSDMYLFPWIQTVFLKYLPLKIASRVWDNFLLDGVTYLFRTAIAILSLLAPALVDSEMDVVMPLLQKHHKVEKFWRTLVTEERLFKAIERIFLSTALKKRLDQLNTDVYKFMD